MYVAVISAMRMPAAPTIEVSAVCCASSRRHQFWNRVAPIRYARSGQVTAAEALERSVEA